KTKNERPIVTVAKLPTSVVRSSGELSASVEREFAGDASAGDGGDQGFDSVGGQDDVKPSVPVTEPVAPRFSINGRTGCSSSSATASPLEEGGDRTKSANPKVDSLVRSAAPVMTEATTVATVATTVAIPADVSKDKSAPHPSVFGSSSSSEKTGCTLSLFTVRSGSGFDA
ncbi:hypothetical protein Tco_1195874, partial [Tanacetum coccineum]